MKLTNKKYCYWFLIEPEILLNDFLGLSTPMISTIEYISI